MGDAAHIADEVIKLAEDKSMMKESSKTVVMAEIYKIISEVIREIEKKISEKAEEKKL